jgi:hypothetical protein
MFRRKQKGDLSVNNRVHESGRTVKAFLVAGLFWTLGAGTALAADSLPEPGLRSDSTYSETYSLTAYGDGAIVQLQFGVTNLGWGSGRAICRLYLQHGNARVRKHEMYARKQWTFAAAPVTSLTAPGCSFRGGSAPRFSAALEGDEVTVSGLAPLQRLATPQTGVAADGGEYRSQLLLAASPATITWKRKEGTQTFRGFAHIDHSVTTLLPGKIAAGWLRFRALDGEAPLVFSLRLPPDSRHFSGWQLRGSGLAPFKALEPEWWPTSQEKSVIELPAGKLVLGPLVEVFEPLNDLGILRHAAELLVGRPRTLLYWAEFQGRRGLLEVATQE